MRLPENSRTQKAAITGHGGGRGGPCPEKTPGVAGGGERSCCGTGGCFSRPSPRAVTDAWVSWAGTAGLRYFRSKSNQMRIYNPS